MDIEDSELNEEETAKALGQFRLALNGVLNPLRLYGQGYYVDAASEEILKLAWVLHWKLIGLDIPYEVEDLH